MVVEGQVGPHPNIHCLLAVPCLLHRISVPQLRRVGAWCCVVQAVGDRACWLYVCACVPVDQGIDTSIAKVLVLFDHRQPLKLSRPEKL